MRFRFCAGWIGLLGGLASACGGEVPQRHVLLVTLDTTRQDRLSCYGYRAASGEQPGAFEVSTPHLDSISRRGVRFARAYTASPVTLPSHASIFTGVHPRRHGVLDNSVFRLGEGSETLAERLSAEGFETAAFVSASVLAASFGLNQGFGHYDAEIDTGTTRGPHFGERPAGETTDRVLAWVAGSGAPQQFLWVHYFDPHFPRRAPDSLSKRFQDPYDAEVAYMDQEFGRLLAGLDRIGWLGDALVVVVSDHGEGLGDHQEISHGYFLYEEVVKVPLLVAGPGLPEGQVVEDVVSTIDIVPTVLDWLDLPVPAELRGESLLAAIDGAAVEHDVYFETYTPELDYGWSWLAGMREQRTLWKYIDAPLLELYDLASDPAEAANLAGDRSEIVERLAASLESMGSDASSAQPPAVAIEPASDLRAALEHLGYLTALPTRSATRGPDVKDVFHHVIAREEANYRLAKGELRGVVELLEGLLDASPRKALAHQHLAQAHQQIAAQRAREGSATAALDGLSKAAKHFEAARVELPDSELILYNLAETYLASNRTPQAEELLVRVLELDPEMSGAHHLLGLIHLNRGEYARALPLLDRHMQLVPLSDGEVDRRWALSCLSSGVGLLHLGRRAEAAARFRRAQLAAPGWTQPEFWLGQLALEEGRSVEASQHLVRYLEAPDRPKLAQQANQMLERLEAAAPE